MTTTIPRAEINAVAHRHEVDFDLDSDPTVEWVRGVAAYLRARGDWNLPAPASVLAEADGLAALADRYEKPDVPELPLRLGRKLNPVGS